MPCAIRPMEIQVANRTTLECLFLAGMLSNILLNSIPSLTCPAVMSETPHQCEAALAELFTSAPGYSGHSWVRPYSEALVALPMHGATGAAEDIVLEADRPTLSGWRQHMMLDESGEEDYLSEPNRWDLLVLYEGVTGVRLSRYFFPRRLSVYILRHWHYH